MIAIGVGVTSSGAFAQTLSGTPSALTKADRNAEYLERLAANPGITVDALKSANLATQNQLVDAAVTAGRLTPDQATVVKARLAEAGGARLGVHFGRRGPNDERATRPAALLRSAVDAVTAYVWIDQATLKSELAAGKSLAQIAIDHGKTREGLKAAIAPRLPAGIDTPTLDRLIDAWHPLATLRTARAR